MKKTLITSVLLSLAVGAFAQGTIDFGNSFTGVFRAPIYNVNPTAETVAQVGQSALGLPAGNTVYSGALLSGANYMMGLYVGSSAGNLRLITTDVFRTGATPTALPNGLVLGKLGVVIDGIAAGSPAFFQIKAWDTRSGASWETALIRGESAVVQSGPLGGISPGGPVLSPQTVGWQSFSLAVVPEPSVIALGALGLGALLLRRRK